MSAPLRVVLFAVSLFLLSAPRAAAAPDPVGLWPLHPTPPVVNGFEPPSTTWGAGHRGVDLGGSVGQHVRAALPGTVSFVGMIAGRGVVVVDHGDTRTTYEPVTADLERGAMVEAGDRLGVLALPGSHCFPRACLHWGWIRDETYLDPLRLVGAMPVRLLPLGGLPSVAPIPATPYTGWQPLLRLLHPGVPS